MIRWWVLGVYFTGIPLAWAYYALPAGAQNSPACALHDAMIKALHDRYSERVVANATMGESLVELTVSSSRSWTLVVTNPQSQLSCLVAGGEDWARVESEPQGPPGKDASQ